MAATLEEEKKMIDEAERDLLHTYNRYQVVLDRGDGMYLYDVTGKKYLDFMAGIAVFAFGYNNKEYNDALKAQIDKIIHTSNYFYNEPCIRAAKRLKEISGMDRVFFTNSGAESNEGALKAAMKYAWLKDKDENHNIVALENSFHGRTYGALAVTGNAHYREPFGQMVCDVRFGKMNDFESVSATQKLRLLSLRSCRGRAALFRRTRNSWRASAHSAHREIFSLFSTRFSAAWAAPAICTHGRNSA